MALAAGLSSPDNTFRGADEDKAVPVDFTRQ